MSNDTIYREDAIKVVSHVAMECIDRKTRIELINAIPSADRPQDDTVSRRYLLAEIDDLTDEFSELDENGLHSERWCGIMDSKGIIVSAPSVADRLQGEWIESFKSVETRRGAYLGTKFIHNGWSCSECSEVVEKRYPNCPYCLARMKGATDGSK